MTLVASAACTGDEGVDLTVKIRTDYQPIRDFIAIRVEVEDEQSQEDAARVDSTYLDPSRELAFFSKIQPSAERKVKVSLLDAMNEPFAQTAIVFEHLDNFIVTIGLDRTCLASTECAADGERTLLRRPMRTR